MCAYHLLHRFSLLIALGGLPFTALAQHDSAGLKAAVDAAWQRSPLARTLEARLDEAQAGQEAAQTWVAGSPSIGLAQRSDRWTDQNGFRETEVSVSAPIWLPGQKSARQALAVSNAENLNAQIANAKLTLAGEVREQLWAVAAAREASAEAQDHLHHLEGLADEVMRRVKAGDLARADSLLAQQEVLAAKSLVASAQSKEREAVTRYMALTGHADIPQPKPERLAVAMQEPHPRVLATRLAVDKAQAALHVVNATRSDSPTVGLSMRQERDAYQADSSKSVGISVQIPLGTRSRNRPLETAANTEIATATAEARQVETTLQTEINLAKQQLTMAHAALDTATQRAALTREHTQLIEKAFRLGERGLAELIRSQALSHEAEVAARQQQVAVGLTHARLNQALGIVP